MKPPVDHVKISTKSKDILIKIKRNTGLEHWNVICRIAYCRSLADPTCPPKHIQHGESNIDMDWKTFAGQFTDEFSLLTQIKAKKDGINILNKNELSEYFKDHLERGISRLQTTKSLVEMIRN